MRRFRLEDTRYLYECTRCHKEASLSADQHRTVQLTCSACDDAMYKFTGGIMVLGIDESILSDMRHIANTRLTHHHSDVQLDMQVLATYGGRFLWATRPMGTSLLLLDLPGTRKFSECHGMFLLNNSDFWYFNGSLLHSITEDEARAYWRALHPIEYKRG